jgi:hypothetical protein
LLAKNLAENGRTRIVIARLASFIFILSLICVLLWRGNDERALTLADFWKTNGFALVISMIVALSVFLALYVIPYLIGARAAVSWSKQLSSFETSCMSAIVNALSRPATIDRVRTTLAQIESVVDQERMTMLEREGLSVQLDLVSRVNQQLQALQARAAAPAVAGLPEIAIDPREAVRHDLFVETLPSDPRFIHLGHLDEIMIDLRGMAEQLNRAGADEATVERLGAGYARAEAQQIPDIVAQGERKPHLLIAAASVISLMTPVATKIGSDYVSYVTDAVRHVLGI